MLPLICDIREAVTPRNDIQEHEQALFDADIRRQLRCDVLDDPVGELEEGLLIEVAEVVEPVGNSEEQADGSPRTGTLNALHARMGTRTRTHGCVSVNV